ARDGLLAQVVGVRAPPGHAIAMRPQALPAALDGGVDDRGTGRRHGSREQGRPGPPGGYAPVYSLTRPSGGSRRASWPLAPARSWPGDVVQTITSRGVPRTPALRARGHLAGGILLGELFVRPSASSSPCNHCNDIDQR